VQPVSHGRDVGRSRQTALVSGAGSRCIESGDAAFINGLIKNAGGGSDGIGASSRAVSCVVSPHVAVLGVAGIRRAELSSQQGPEFCPGPAGESVALPVDSRRRLLGEWLGRHTPRPLLVDARRFLVGDGTAGGLQVL